MFLLILILKMSNIKKLQVASHSDHFNTVIELGLYVLHIGKTEPSQTAESGLWSVQ